jgi:hypothetical protein
MMLPALKLSLNGFKLRDHPLLRRNPPNDESSAAVELPTEVSETQEREGFWFSFPTIFPVSGSKPPEFDQSCHITSGCRLCGLLEESNVSAYPWNQAYRPTTCAPEPGIW